jgi:membrane fusion protein, multidrug efflux system
MRSLIEVLFHHHNVLSGRGIHAPSSSSCTRTLKRHARRAPATLAAAACLGLLALTFTGCKPAETLAAAKKPESPAVNVKLAQPSRCDIVRSISLPATVAANQQAALYSKVAGYLKVIHVDKGDEVIRGQLLAEIEVPELLADLARYKAEAEIADIDYKRAIEAHRRAPDLIVAQSVDTARAKSLMAKANLERAETLLSFCRIIAPFPGIVTRRTVDPGAFIPVATSGSAAQNAVVTLMDFDIVRVQVAVPELEVPLIRKGISAKVTVEQLPGRVFDGNVTRFSQALDDATKTMLTEIDLPNPGRELRPGMFATVRLGIEKRSDILAVPVEAVLFEKSGTSVFTIADGKAKKVRVKTGFNDGARVEILEGIGPDDPVILVGKMVLATGQAVNIAEGE